MSINCNEERSLTGAAPVQVNSRHELALQAAAAALRLDLTLTRTSGLKAAAVVALAVTPTMCH